MDASIPKFCGNAAQGITKGPTGFVNRQSVWSCVQAAGTIFSYFELCYMNCKHNRPVSSDIFIQ